LKDLEGKIDDNKKEELKGIIETLRESYKNKDIEKINQFMNELNQKFQEVSQKLYEQTTEDSQEEHSDVEFEEVK
jgi:molecular chaperone DnaK